MKKILKEQLNHLSDDFDNFNYWNFVPESGEGETQATQAATATAKLVYKWYNDGDVYDNTYSLEGWANDLSSYANWLYENVPSTQATLERISKALTDEDYEKILWALSTIVDEELRDLSALPKVDSIYDAQGIFKFEVANDYDDDSYEDEYEDKYEDEYEESTKRINRARKIAEARKRIARARKMNEAKRRAAKKSLKRVIKEHFEPHVHQMIVDYMDNGVVSEEEIANAIRKALANLNVEIIGGPSNGDISWSREEYGF